MAPAIGAFKRMTAQPWSRGLIQGVSLSKFVQDMSSYLFCRRQRRLPATLLLRSFLLGLFNPGVLRSSLQTLQELLRNDTHWESSIPMAYRTLIRDLVFYCSFDLLELRVHRRQYLQHWHHLSPRAAQYWLWILHVETCMFFGLWVC